MAEDSGSPRERRSLAGRWRFALDPNDAGVEERWFASVLEDAIDLPGTTDEARKGEYNGAREPEHLTRTHPYEGVAWYQRDVTIPEGWAERRVVLTLERTRSTRVWVDDTPIGHSDALSTPQAYDLTDALTPGDHVLTIRVDNDSPVMALPGVQRSHMATEHTQTNWNGIVGMIALDAIAPVWIDDLRVATDAAAGTATVTGTLGNRTGTPATGELVLAACGENASAKEHASVEHESASGEGSTHSADESMDRPDERTVAVELDGAETTVTTTYDLGDDPRRWDEFSPATYTLDVRLDASTAEADDGARYTDATTTRFGLRGVETAGTEFVVNDRTTFLRGTVDCCVFPETGYAPTTREAWREHLETLRAFGLNHCRFHSWCPPEAAFDAADDLGIYLQVELPLWNSEDAFVDGDAAAFYRAEAERILDAYGDHPSFVLFALGNELCGSHEGMVELVEHCRAYDPRHLYTIGSYPFLSDSTPTGTDDFWVTSSIPSDLTDADSERLIVRGSSIEDEAATTHDYEAAIQDVSMPVVAHEIGQYQSYSDYAGLDRYDGVLRPRNLELARAHLEAHRLGDRAETFARASGALALRCYREEVEAALRTPGFGGFQLLALQDFPGQGTALVGLRDVFMEPKGIVEPERWRRFCAPTVALARLERRTWTTDESLDARIQVAHYGRESLDGVVARWTLTDEAGRTVASGELPAADVPQGDVIDLGTVTPDLTGVDAPVRLTLELTLGAHDGEGFPVDGPLADGPAANEYDLWVFPADASEPRTGDIGITDDTDADDRDTDVPNDDSGSETADGVIVRRTFDERAKESLAEGANVLLVPHHEELHHAVEGAFRPVFWSYALFKHRAPAETMGSLCDPEHPLFASFPTAAHADWQWWSLLEHARPIVLDDAPDDYRPLVSMIDTVERNQRLGLVFETAVDEGSLLVCAIDLFACADAPAARGLFDALTEYASSSAFDPDAELSVPVLEKLLSP